MNALPKLLCCSAKRLEKQTFHSGAYTLYGYDNRSRTTSVSQKKSDNSTISAEVYVYDAASNLVTKTIDNAITTYTYDEIDQLLSEGKSGYAGSYTCDANGNRLTKTLGGTTETYSYSDSDELIDIKVGGTTVKSFGYDAAGRTTGITYSGATTTLAYDYESRITSISRSGVTTNTFTYNGLDTRVGKVDSGGTKTFKRDGAYVTDPVLSVAPQTTRPASVSVGPGRRNTTSKTTLAHSPGKPIPTKPPAEPEPTTHSASQPGQPALQPAHSASREAGDIRRMEIMGSSS